MYKEARVLIVEDDPYARNWMALILARDWRTRLLADVGSPEEMSQVLEDEAQEPDLVILDTEMPGDHSWLGRALETLTIQNPPPAVIFTATHPNLQMLRKMQTPALRGYVLKTEIEFCLAWAVDLALGSNWVMTPSVEALAIRADVQIPRPCYVIDGRKSVWSLTEHQLNVARLAFLFSMERRELADELQVTPEWSYGLVSGLYKELGIGSPPSLDFDPRALFGENRILLDHFDRLASDAKSSRKGKDLETLAFHLLTIPEIRALE